MMIKNSKILIVDDEPRLCDSLKTLLCSKTYGVQTCCSGNEALNFLTKDKFDLVLLDIFMEGMDGFQVIEKIMNQKIDTPVIIMTGNASTESAVKALRMGATDYLKKPFESEELFSSVKNALTQRMLKKENELIKKKFQESEKKYRDILEGLNDAAYRMSLPDGKYEYFSQAAKSVFGYESNHWLNNSNLIRKIIHPDFADYLKQKWADLIKGKISSTYEYKIIDPKGNERWIFQSNKGIFDNQGKIVAIEGLCRNITEYKRTEYELKESEKKYRQLFKNAPAGIYEIDFIKVKFINVNEVMCKYSGYSEEEFLSMNPLDLLTEESKNLYIERLSIEKNMTSNVKYTIIKKDGQKIDVILNSDFIYKNGTLTGARVVAHDITELKQAEKEKIKAQKIAGEQKKLALIGQVAGKMAHDFNNILGIIMGNAQLSLLDCKEERTIKTLKLIFEQTIRGKNLTNNLVAFAREQEPKQEFFKIKEKSDLVLNLLKRDLEGVELIKKDKSGVPELLADPGMIEHVLVNLVQNSIHAISTVKHPKISIKTFLLNENICFEIEDNGCGISKEYMEKICEPSFTLKGSKDITGSYTTDIKGTGYGMANVKKYIEQHKGSVSIDSKFGSGTKVTISLPVIKKELTSEEKIEIREEISHFEKYILLVEDEIAISDIQYRILTQEPCNHKIDIANNGQVAMDLFDRNEYDFVSLDYVLPGGINGMDVYNHIRKTNETIPILFISGNIEFLESIKELKQKDAKVDHLSKPCQNKDYINAINRLLGRSLAAQ